MPNEAIKKIQDEIEAEKKNSYVQYVGKYMIEYLNKNNGYAQNILDETKSIKGSLLHMEAEAKKGLASEDPEEQERAIKLYMAIKTESQKIDKEKGTVVRKI